MLLGYFHSDDYSQQLCLIADKTDAYSKAVPIVKLKPTIGGVCRFGQYEAVLVSGDLVNGGLEVLPVRNTKIYITPSLPDLPGMSVDALRFKLLPDGSIFTQFQQIRDRQEGKWRDWRAELAQ